MRCSIIAMLLILVILAGCNTITGHITIDKEQLLDQALQDCTSACAKCNPKALTASCRETCVEYYENGGMLKLTKYTDLYSVKCKDFGSD